MDADADSPLQVIEKDFALNLKRQREAEDLSQEEVARRMTAAGFPFVQATVWKIEQGQRQVKIAEAVALGHAVNLGAYWESLLEPSAVYSYSLYLQAAHDELEREREHIARAVRQFLLAQRRFNLVVEEADHSGLPEDARIWNVLTGTHTESPEFVALEAHLQDEADLAGSMDRLARSKRLVKIWNELMPERVDHGQLPEEI